MLRHGMSYKSCKMVPLVMCIVQSDDFSWVHEHVVSCRWWHGGGHGRGKAYVPVCVVTLSLYELNSVDVSFPPHAHGVLY